ncbi:MAG: carbohydrate ABC transporter permease [Clostridia bacterium]|nr:carbohydrate ABC transporter permease [Clostridia bacterium]
MVTTRESPQRNRIRNSRSDRIFYAIVTVVITLFTITVLYPILFVIASSFSSGEAVSSGKVLLWPVDFSLDGYRAVLKNKNIGMGYINTIEYTVVGTAVNLAITMLCAYPMSRRDMPLRKTLTFIFCFTMYFGGGLIPSYLLNKNLGLINTFWVMIIPGAMSVYNMIIARTSISTNIPNELLEAATLDGCSDFGFFVRIVLPLSKAIMAVLTLYYAVGHWNNYFSAMIYLNDRDKQPLQIILREILVAGRVESEMMGDAESYAAYAQLADLLKFSLIMVSTVPIMCVYPFIQKYFVKGVMIGSLKG